MVCCIFPTTSFAKDIEIYLCVLLFLILPFIENIYISVKRNKNAIRRPDSLYYLIRTHMVH